ncbi:hypothetical protein AB0J38_35940 [Streptomyces sp. NPDC050095]|uniref:hypothetical protein n=1 Tax=unclassified Streptomyces TaxID=2593676 RepID=UPI00343054D3
MSAAALSAAGMLATTGAAHADAVIQITDSADPVAVNTPYDYVVNPNTNCFAVGAAAECGNAGFHGTSETITLTGLPIDPVEETTGAGQSSLTCNAATDTNPVCGRPTAPGRTPAAPSA